MSAKATTATNGTVASFPVNTFRDAAPHLRRPFTSEAVKFKVQAAWPKENPTGGLVVAYIDARLVVERLNLIVPHLWYDEYEATARGLMWCALTIDGITRRDVGEGQGKGLVSDALKRAAVKFGVGVSLYAIPKMIIDAGQGHAKQKRGRDGVSLEMTPAGENRVRGIYRMWLDEHGTEAFGDPLSHGDVEGAGGDPDESHASAEEDSEAPEDRTRAQNGAPQPTAAPAQQTDRPASAKQRGLLNAKADAAGLPPSDFANAILLATRQGTRSFDSQEAAEQWLKRALDRLPAKYVDGVIEQIEGIGATSQLEAES